MKVCVVCQSELKDDARFCPECGAEQPKVEVAEGEDPLLGAIIAKKFKVEKLLGVGGMGKVYKARQLSLDKAVVVKVLHDQFRDDPQLVQRFQREARAASRLNHPNSIQIIDFGQDETGVVFMAMEFLQGQDLFAMLKTEGALSPERVAKVMIQVCSALAEAHEQNVIHRDLKPENIMIEDRRGQRDFVKVLDFGIAKIQDPAETGGQALTQAGMVCGTPEYMSPEQARGLQLDHRSDIYALGVIMYQLSTGQLPFTADTPIGIVTKHILEQPVPPRQKNPAIPEMLEQIILKAMEKEVDKRFSSVVEIGEALEHLLRTLPMEGSAGFAISPGTGSAPVITAPTAPQAPVQSGGTLVAQPQSQGGAAVVANTDGGGGNGMKIAAAAVVGLLIVGGGVAFAMKDTLFGGPTPSAADAGTLVAAVIDAGATPEPPKVVDAGVAEPEVVDAGAAEVKAPPDKDPTPPPDKDPTPPPDKDPTPPPDKTPPKENLAAAKAALQKVVPQVNKEFLGEGCSDASMKALVGIAQKYKTFPDPMRYIAQCQFKAKNRAGACSAVDEYQRRGASPVAVNVLRKTVCN